MSAASTLPAVDLGATGSDQDQDPPAPEWSLTVLAWIGFVAPIIAYLLLIRAWGVNVPFHDQWGDIQLIGDSYSGHFGFGQLWALHNENRMLVPNLVVLLLSRTTHFNIVTEEYLGSLLLVVSMGLVVVAHRRDLGPVLWLYYCPVAILMLSLVQYQDTLWGFQFAWYLVLATAAFVLFLLDRPLLTWPVVILAIGFGVVGSYSSLQGLIIWPVGLILLLFRRRDRLIIVPWIAAALVTTIVYFIGFQSNQGGALGYSIHHPLVSAKFYLLAIGDVTGLSETGAGGTTVGIELFGLVILTLSVWAIVAYCRGRLAPRGGPLAVAILCFGLLFAAFVTGSRAVVGLSAASQPRYRTFDLLILVGLYLLGMEEFVRWRAARRLGTTTPAEDVDTGSARVRQPQATVFVGLVVLVACMQLALGIPQGVTGARGYHDEQLSAARVLADIAHYPDSFVEAKLGIFQSAAYLRRMSAVAQLHHLSMFGTGAVARYKAEGPIALPTTSIRFVVPHSNSTIKGKQLLGFALSDVFTVTDARFEVTGGSLNHEVISSATPFQYGWIGAWNTTTVPDGHYELQAVASDSGGHTLRTAEVSVTVNNG